ncbi:MAG TPA: hypothetical protein VFQ21_00650 [Gemmatimonadota bacterium]|nr:hypothetical protein [Gemmatimonadota bacterium]
MSPAPRRPNPIRSFAAVAIVLLAVSSCRTWQEWNGPPAAALAEKPDRVRVTNSEGRQFTIVSPVLEGDSLIGFPLFGPMGVQAPRSAIATADIQRIELRGVSGTRTVLAVGGGVTLLLVAAAAIGAATEDPAPPPSDVSSCPLVYSWDGERWRLDSGTFGGAITEALARTDVDNLDYATASADGIVRLKVANELAETDYVDALRLLVVDHPIGTTVAPSSQGEIRGLREPRPPDAARGLDGTDALARLAARDGWSWESSLSTPVAGRDPRDGLELEFARPPQVSRARLVVDGRNTPWAAHLLAEYLRAHGAGLDAWYASLDEDPARARRFFGRLADQAFLRVSVLTYDGWRTQALVWEAGPEIVKRQVVSLDLSRVGGETVRVRLTAPASFWLVDHAAIDYGPEPSFIVRDADVATARQPDGTDVRAPFADQDGSYWVARTGDSAEVRFRVPSPTPGRARTYLIASSGWYRVDAHRDGPPDEETLTRIESEPDAIARISLERREAALSALEGLALSR